MESHGFQSSNWLEHVRTTSRENAPSRWWSTDWPRIKITVVRRSRSLPWERWIKVPNPGRWLWKYPDTSNIYIDSFIPFRSVLFLSIPSIPFIPFFHSIPFHSIHLFTYLLNLYIYLFLSIYSFINLFIPFQSSPFHLFRIYIFECIYTYKITTQYDMTGKGLVFCILAFFPSCF